VYWEPEFGAMGKKTYEKMWNPLKECNDINYEWD
jgi:hypothetical protein